MNTTRSAPAYDLFKLIVALILLALLIVMLLRFRPSIIAEQASAPPPGAAAAPQEQATPTLTPTVQPLLPTPTFARPTPTPTAPPAEPTQEPAPQPTPTPAVTLAPSPTPTVEQPAATKACPSLPSRLTVGMSARVVTNLHFRSSPGIQDNWLRTHPAGATLEVVGGPECVPHGSGAYLWWQLKSPDGTTGWSAEGSLRGGNYFLEPAP